MIIRGKNERQEVFCEINIEALDPEKDREFIEEIIEEFTERIRDRVPNCKITIETACRHE